MRNRKQENQDYSARATRAQLQRPGVLALVPKAATESRKLGRATTQLWIWRAWKSLVVTVEARLERITEEARDKERKSANTYALRNLAVKRERERRQLMIP